MKLRAILRILLSILLILAGLCLMWACVGIYCSGDQPFTRESVAAAFGTIRLPVYLCLGVMAAAIAAELALPCPDKKTRPPRQSAMLLHRQALRTDLSACPESLRADILALRARRRTVQRTGWLINAISAGIFLSYGADPGNFHQTHINSSMIRAMVWLVPCCAVPFAYWLWAARRNLADTEAELALLKTAPAHSRIPLPTPKPRSTAPRNVLLVLAVVLLVYGFLAGGTADVLTKAVNICTECVGLG